MTSARSHSSPLLRPWLCMALIWSTISACSMASHVMVNTTRGAVVGSHSSQGNRFAIPYASSPTGLLRFADPLPVPTYQSLDATGLPPACPQPGVNGSENCLFVTIYTPASVTPTTTTKLPVFFWIHGGSFYYGSSSDPGLDGTKLANQQQVIVVMVQYRLGVLGQLRLDRLGLTGNYAVKDVLLALQYVRDNIAAFGGDKSSVTIAGESSGAELVKTLMVVPQAAALFTRAILQSAPLSFGDRPAKMANQIGELVSLNCTTISCLQSASVADILAAQTALQTQSSPTFAAANVPGVEASSEFLRPTVDGILVPVDFGQAVRTNTRYASGFKTMILTTVKNEACPTVASILPTPLDPNYFVYVVGQIDSTNAPAITTSELYDPTPNTTDARVDISDYLTDELWTCPNQQTALNITSSSANTGSVYLGEFKLGISYAPVVPLCAGDTVHEDDIYVVFNTAPTALSSGQQRLVTEVQSRWGSFIRTGSPNPTNVRNLPRWSPVTSSPIVLQLGGSVSNPGTSVATIRINEACTGFWGVQVPFENQLLQNYY